LGPCHGASFIGGDAAQAGGVSAWLIGEREFRAYVGTTSFWAAALVVPLLMLVMVLTTRTAAGPPLPTSVRISGSDPSLANLAAAAMSDAATADGRRIVLLPPNQAGAASRVDVARGKDGGIEVRLSGSLHLSMAARTLFVRSLELGAARQRLGGPSELARLLVTPTPADAAAAGALGRIATVLLLWLTLTGSLGMLLQAVVRERSNRSLESLLAAASPTDIVLGKLLGVGAVSAVVLVAWLGSVAALAPLTPMDGTVASAVLRGVADPASLARDGAIYVLAFAFYGFVTIAVGARARDSADAQNLARPLFAVLLVAFFVCLATSVGAGAQLAWLAYAAPFTPFMLLLEPAGRMTTQDDVAALAAMAAATAFAGLLAVGGLTLSPRQLLPRLRGKATAAK
jgi:ABC-2 type transport system permease protein